MTTQLGRVARWEGQAEVDPSSPRGGNPPPSFQIPGPVANADAPVWRVVDAFAPSQPVRDVSRFTGRSRLLDYLISAVEEYRSHVALFGAPGTGKTSLALAMSSLAERASYRTFYISSGRNSTLQTIFEPVLAAIPRRLDRLFDPRQGHEPTSTFAHLLPGGRITPPVLGEILARLAGSRLLIVLDELDRRDGPDLVLDLIETMKILSDRGAPVHFVLVGAADSIDDLLGDRSKLPRSLFNVKVGLMEPEEIADVAGAASQQAGLDLRPSVIDRIARIAGGRPVSAKTLGLESAKAALSRGSSVIEDGDLEAAMRQISSRVEAAGDARLSALVAGHPGLKAVLCAALRASRSKQGAFSMDDLAAQLSQAGAEPPERASHLLHYLSEGEHRILQGRLIDGAELFRFVDPAAELYVALLCDESIG